MCEDCGCGLTEALGETEARRERRIAVMEDLLAGNDAAAAHNRAHFDRTGTFAVNLMSAPGAGKTRLIEATIEALGGTLSMAVIEGDLETERDAERIRAKGVPAYQITTGSACHLDAAMVHDALHAFPLNGVELLFIENVGNLLCPASFDLGQHANVVLLSLPEGDDKAAKYPVMFRNADLVLATKHDLAAAFPDFSLPRVREYLADIGCRAPLLPVGATSEAGIAPWLDWLRADLAGRRSGASRAVFETGG